MGLINLSFSLFEKCDEIFELNTDENITISSGKTLNAYNASSCRYTIIAPFNYIVDVTCSLRIDQPDSQKCPIRRFFVSVDGIKDLHGADYFCNRNDTTRTLRRRSVLNRLVLAYATQTDVGKENFHCVAKRIESRCDCGWSRRVSIDSQDHKLCSFFFEKKVFSKYIFRLEFIMAWMLICTSFPQCWP